MEATDWTFFRYVEFGDNIVWIVNGESAILGKRPIINIAVDLQQFYQIRLSNWLKDKKFSPLVTSDKPFKKDDNVRAVKASLHQRLIRPINCQLRYLTNFADFSLYYYSLTIH